MPIARILRPVISWFAHHIARGAAALGLIPGAQVRYPDLPIGSIEQAAELGQQAVENASLVQQLEPQQPLSDILQGRAPPEDEVETRTLVTLRDAAGQIDDMLIRVTVPWSSTLGELIDIIEGAIRNRLARSPGLIVVNVDIVPPFLLGPP